MTQLTFVFVGVVLALIYKVALRARRMSVVAAIFVAGGGAWAGALIAAAVAGAGWASWGPASLLGSFVGGAGSLALMNGFVAYALRREA